MEFRILGPVEVWDEGRRRPLGGSKQRALLIALLLRANETVPADRLIDDLWGEDPSENAPTALRVNVSRLRKALPRETLVTQTPGYMIHIRPDQLDLYRFERLVEDGRRRLAGGRPSEAAELMREALSLWRGPALADVSYESFAQSAIARLEEMRLAALELRLEIDLACGRDRELVGELEALVVEHPLRERLRAQLMLALYRSGRQAEAIDAYQDARRALVEELGIEPGPKLQELQQAILQQDKAIEAQESPPVSGVGTERSILAAIFDEAHADRLLALATSLAVRPPRVVILAKLVAEGSELGPSSVWLERRRSTLAAIGVTARVASFTTPSPGEELARLASELDVELLLADAQSVLLAEGFPDAQLTSLLAGAPCDVALLVSRPPREGPVLVPFGGVEHDWAAVEVAAWVARADRIPLQLVGAEAVPEREKRDASRLLSHASLAIQRVLGVSAEPLLAPPGEEGLLEATRDAGLIVVGLSTRWHREGLGQARLRLAREASAPILFVRRGLKPGGLAPPNSLTHFTWSIRA